MKKKQKEIKKYKLFKMKNNLNKQFINKMIKRDIMVYAILIFSILFLTATSSYAYFTLSKSETMENIVSATVEGVSITNTNIEVSDLVPANGNEVATSVFNHGENQCKDENGNNICFLYEFTIKNNGDATRNILYYLTPTKNTFNNLNFAVYSGSKDSINEDEDSLVMDGTYIPKKNDKIPLTNMTKKISPNETLTYTMMFLIIKQDGDQTIYDASRTFDGQLSIELLTEGEYDNVSPVVSTLSANETQRTFNDGKLSEFVVNFDYPLEEDVVKYVVEVYDSEDNLKIKDEITDTSIQTKTYKGLDHNMLPGEYKISVYGVDKYNNSGEIYCNDPDSDYCKTVDVTLKYPLKYNLSNSNTNISVSNAYYGQPVTFSAQSTSSMYTFNSWSVSDATTGEIIESGNTAVTNYTTATPVYNDFQISASATGCLVEGTKVLLANGKYKNVEDIDYNDLLVVMDYENGGITYQYPLWIEKEDTSDNYIRINFSDNSYIDIVSDHGFFSFDDNEFVAVTDKDKFHVGTRVAKLVNNKLEEVTVKSIETINEEVKFYLVTTTRYYNSITNGFITTDDGVDFVNLYGFNSDITWKNPQATDLYTEKELSILDKYLYKGYRAGEAKYMAQYGLDYDTFIGYLYETVLNEDIWLQPELNENGKREWMVTTSEDVVTEDNKLSYLMEEGDYYTLKAPKNINGKKFIGWLHTGENIMYQPGDKVEVLYGTHFVAKYQDLFNSNNNFGVKR